MIFNVMENKEELLFALKEFREGEVSDISSNLEQYISHVSKTGETMFAWPLIQPLLTQKLRRVSDDFYAEMPTDTFPSRPNTENVQFHELQTRVLEHINRFSGTPFTIQRLCELLVNPRSHYTRPDKFLRGIEKIVMVVSTMEAMKVANGSATSAASDDEVSDVDKGSSSSLNGVWCGGPASPSAKLSPNRPASPALDLTDRPDRPGPLSPSHPLSTGKLAESDLSVASLRPMGQLEAFVQNVSQRLTNQINATHSNGSTKEQEKDQPALATETATGGRLSASPEPSDGAEGSRKAEMDSSESKDPQTASPEASDRSEGSGKPEMDSSESQDRQTASPKASDRSEGSGKPEMDSSESQSRLTASPEASERSEGSRKREIDSLVSQDRLQEQTEKVGPESEERPAKVPRLDDWKSSDSGEKKEDEEKKEETEEEMDASTVKDDAGAAEIEPAATEAESDEKESVPEQSHEEAQSENSKEGEDKAPSESEADETGALEKTDAASKEADDEIAPEEPSPEVTTDSDNTATSPQEMQENAEVNADAPN